MKQDPALSPPAFYAAPRFARRGWLADWWVVLHPPYTLWHLAYVAIGATIAPEFSGVRLVATLMAFFLAVGLAAHALDEFHSRPLRTRIPDWQLIAVSVGSLGGAVAIGVAGVQQVGPGLVIFIITGVVLNVGYNLELFGGPLHNDVTFALAWGAFPVLTAYFAQAETLRLPAFLAAGFAYWLSAAQRSLSTEARSLRRRVAEVEGVITYTDGHTKDITRGDLLFPIEAALKATTWSVITLATALVAFRALAP